MQKFVDILFHPSHIVFYYKDKAYKVILWVLAFFCFVCGLFALYTYTSKGYDYDYISSFSSSLQTSQTSYNTKFEDNKLTGKTIIIKGNNVNVYFLKSDFANNNLGLVMNFKEESVDIYYHTYFKKSLNYADLNINNFSFEDVRNNNRVAVLEFESLILRAVDVIDIYVKTVSLFEECIDVLILYAAITLFAVIFSIFINPPIDIKSRIKICMYDSLIYFAMMGLTLMVGISWMQYVAMALPLLFTLVSFKSIVRIK